MKKPLLLYAIKSQSDEKVFVFLIDFVCLSFMRQKGNGANDF